MAIIAHVHHTVHHHITNLKKHKKIHKMSKEEILKCCNPFNIRYSKSNNWEGQTGEYNGFVVFKSMEYGVRAGIVTLINGYFDKGLNTITKIITKYAPPKENDTAKYIAFVSEKMGVNAYYKMDKNANNLSELGSAIIEFENGKSYIDSTYVLNVIHTFNILPIQTQV